MKNRRKSHANRWRHFPRSYGNLENYHTGYLNDVFVAEKSLENFAQIAIIKEQVLFIQLMSK
jgi:hypothetical protein